MESGSDVDKSVHTGWLNRMLHLKREAEATAFRAVAMTPLIPRTLQGDAEALAIRDLETFGVVSSGSSLSVASGFEGMYDGAVDGVLHGAGKESFDAIAMLKKANPSQNSPANKAVYPCRPIRPGDAPGCAAHQGRSGPGSRIRRTRRLGHPQQPGRRQRPACRAASRLLSRHRRLAHRSRRSHERCPALDDERIGRPPGKTAAAARTTATARASSCSAAA